MHGCPQFSPDVAWIGQDLRTTCLVHHDFPCVKTSLFLRFVSFSSQNLGHEISNTFQTWPGDLENGGHLDPLFYLPTVIAFRKVGPRL